MDARNLTVYETNYQNHDFEVIQADLRRQHVLAYLNQFETKKVLEIGCGLAPLFQFIDQFDLFHVVEPSQKFHQNAENLAKKHLLNANIKVYNQYLEQFEREIDYNLIVCTALLHEVENDEAFLAGIRRNCNANTRVYLNTINVNSFHRVLAKEAGLIKDVYELSATQKKLQQYRTYSIDELKNLVKKCGFSIETDESIIFKPFTHKQMMSLLKNDIISKEVLTALSNMAKYFPESGSELSFTLKKL